jgi:hypothetical protein
MSPEAATLANRLERVEREVEALRDEVAMLRHALLVLTQRSDAA